MLANHVQIYSTGLLEILFDPQVLLFCLLLHNIERLPHVVNGDSIYRVNLSLPVVLVCVVPGHGHRVLPLDISLALREFSVPARHIVVLSVIALGPGGQRLNGFGLYHFRRASATSREI